MTIIPPISEAISPPHSAVETLRFQIDSLIGQGPLSLDRGDAYWVVGCHPGQKCYLDHVNYCAEIIPAVLEAMRSEIKGIVIADEPLILNASNGWGLPASDLYRMIHATPLTTLRDHARIVGQRDRALIQAIQRHLILTRQVDVDCYKPVTLMSRKFNLPRVRELFDKLFNLLLEPNARLGSVYGSPFTLRDDSFASRVWSVLPTFIKKLSPEFTPGHPVSHELINILFYILFQVAYVLFQGGAKHGFAGEVPYDELTQHCLQYADELGLDECSRGLTFHRLSGGGADVPYRSAKFGDKPNYNVLALGGYNKVGDMVGHFNAVLERDFPIYEASFLDIAQDRMMEDLPHEQLRPDEAVDYLRQMFNGRNNGDGFEVALRIMKPDDSLRSELEFAKNYKDSMRLPLRRKMPVRQEVLYSQVMNALNEIVAVLIKDSRIKDILSDSGVLSILNQEKPIHDLNHHPDGFVPEEMSEYSRYIARICWLRNRITRLKLASWLGGDASELQDELFTLLLGGDLLSALRSRATEPVAPLPLVYLIRQIIRLISPVVSGTPSLALPLNDLFKRLIAVLQPDYSLDVDCGTSYWNLKKR